MIILSIDTETTAIDPKDGQLLSLGAVAYDTVKNENLGVFHGCVNYPSFYGEPIALSMNAELLRYIGEGKGDDIYNNLDSLFTAFGEFLSELVFDKQLKVTLCGKNFLSFDEKWLDAKCDETYRYTFRQTFDQVTFTRRYLDVGPMFAIMTDEEVPNLQLCMYRAGMKQTVTHNAQQDARDVLNCALYKLQENEKHRAANKGS